MKKLGLYLCSVLIATVISTGCTSNTPQETPEQKKAFMGGPMPADFQQKQAEMMKKAAEEAQKKQGAANQGNSK